MSEASGGGLSYEYVGDAVLLLVSPREAAAPLSLFEAPKGWFFGPGLTGSKTFDISRAD